MKRFLKDSTENSYQIYNQLSELAEKSLKKKNKKKSDLDEELNSFFLSYFFLIPLNFIF